MIFVEDKKMGSSFEKRCRIIKDAEENMFHVSGIAYSDVQLLQKALDSHNIRNHIDAGGLFIFPCTREKIKKMEKICKTFKTTAIPGVSRHMSDVILNVKKIEKTPFPKA